MSRKTTPEAQVKQARAKHRADKLARLPPNPSLGGAYRVDGEGTLVPDGAETPVETPVKEA